MGEFGAEQHRRQDGRAALLGALGRSGKVSSRALGAAAKALARLPRLEGSAVRVRFERNLHAWRGRVVSGDHGTAVHAGSMLRARVMVLDAELARSGRELARILLHEIFHFVWLRLGNRTRLDWEGQLQREWRRGARGELGWSAELRKQGLAAADAAARTRRWREYACESFCDSAACFATGSAHAEFTLAGRFRRERSGWFAGIFGRAAIPI